MSLSTDYRDYFIRNLHDALSGHTSSNVAEVFFFINSYFIIAENFLCFSPFFVYFLMFLRFGKNSMKSPFHIQFSLINLQAIQFGERGHVKCIGITIETRPDYCLPRHLDDMLSYGCTRLEIGVQSVYEDVARDTNRGHTVCLFLLIIN